MACDLNSHNLIINELLSFVSHYLKGDKRDLDVIKQSTLNFYSLDEILESKKLLWSICKDILNDYIERKSSENRSSKEASINDIFDAMIKLTDESMLPVFVVKDIENLPDKPPQNTLLLKKINQLEANFKSNEDALASFAADVIQIKDSNSQMKIHQDDIIKIVSDINNKISNSKNNHDEEKSKVNEEHKITEILPQSTNVNVRVIGDSQKDNDDGDNDPLDTNRLMTDNEMIQRYMELKQYSPKKSDKDAPQDSSFELFLDHFDESDLNRASYSDFKRRFSLGVIGKEPNTNILQDNASDNNENAANKDFIVAESRSQARKRRLLKEGLIGAPPALAQVWIARVQRGNSLTIKEHLYSKNINVKEVIKKSHMDAKFSSFKATINKSDLNVVLGSNFWPDGILCRIWKEPNFNNHKTLDFVNRKYRKHGNLL